MAVSKPRSSSNANLLICDDFFPNVLTAFRVAEYNAMLEYFPGARVRSWAGNFRGVHGFYALRFRELADRIAPITPYSFAGAKFVYTNFLNNAYQLLRFGTLVSPFGFVLYPGGGFGLDDPVSDAKLRSVLGSPWLRFVVVTTSVTEQYLQKKMNEWQIPKAVEVHRIDGVAIPADYFAPSIGERPYWPEGREVLNICFAANKYVPRLAHKGYPEFVAAARELAARYAFVRFHVVGGADPTDGDYGAAIDRVTFHHALETANLRALFHEMDLIVSPSHVGREGVGQFDGFPTATCVEASLCGVAMVVSNPLRIEERYSARQAVQIVEPRESSVTNALLELVERFQRDPAALRAMGQAGREVSRERYSFDRQIVPRLQLIEKYL